MLFAIGSFAFGVYFLIQCWNQLQTGVVYLRRWSLFNSTRSEDPVLFILFNAIVFLVGAAFILGAVLQVRALMVGSRSSRETAARSSTALLESFAPSGLAPLWWALFIAVVAFLVYVAA